MPEQIGEISYKITGDTSPIDSSIKTTEQKIKDMKARVEKDTIGLTVNVQDIDAQLSKSPHVLKPQLDLSDFASKIESAISNLRLPPVKLSFDTSDLQRQLSEVQKSVLKVNSNGSSGLSNTTSSAFFGTLAGNILGGYTSGVIAQGTPGSPGINPTAIHTAPSQTTQAAQILPASASRGRPYVPVASPGYFYPSPSFRHTVSQGMGNSVIPVPAGFDAFDSLNMAQFNPHNISAAMNGLDYNAGPPSGMGNYANLSTQEHQGIAARIADNQGITSGITPNMANQWRSSPYLQGHNYPPQDAQFVRQFNPGITATSRGQATHQNAAPGTSQSGHTFNFTGATINAPGSNINAPGSGAGGGSGGNGPNGSGGSNGSRSGGGAPKGLGRFGRLLSDNPETAVIAAAYMGVEMLEDIADARVNDRQIARRGDDPIEVAKEKLRFRDKLYSDVPIVGSILSHINDIGGREHPIAQQIARFFTGPSGIIENTADLYRFSQGDKSAFSNKEDQQRDIDLMEASRDAQHARIESDTRYRETELHALISNRAANVLGLPRGVSREEQSIRNETKIAVNQVELERDIKQREIAQFHIEHPHIEGGSPAAIQLKSLTDDLANINAGGALKIAAANKLEGAKLQEFRTQYGFQTTDLANQAGVLALRNQGRTPEADIKAINAKEQQQLREQQGTDALSTTRRAAISAEAQEERKAVIDQFNEHLRTLGASTKIAGDLLLEFGGSAKAARDKIEEEFTASTYKKPKEEIEKAKQLREQKLAVLAVQEHYNAAQAQSSIMRLQDSNAVRTLELRGNAVGATQLEAKLRGIERLKDIEDKHALKGEGGFRNEKEYQDTLSATKRQNYLDTVEAAQKVANEPARSVGSFIGAFHFGPAVDDEVPNKKQKHGPGEYHGIKPRGGTQLPPSGPLFDPLGLITGKGFGSATKEDKGEGADEVNITGEALQLLAEIVRNTANPGPAKAN